ncbi:MAG: glutamate-5-semialdehyde dehydrogenase [Acidobacteriota bacterium]
MTDEGVVFEEIRELCRRARAAARRLARVDPEAKETALRSMAGGIRDGAARIGEANEVDLAEGRHKDLKDALLDRLRLTPERIEQMAVGLEEIAALRDPVGEVVAQWRRPGGLEVGQVRIPIGVIGIIYESRPNVTADAAGLCFKAGNATILRGGSEALHSNIVLASILREAIRSCGMDPDALQVVETTDRAAVGALLKQNDLVDLIIPRGGKSLIKRVVEESTIPVIKHYEGICHVYVHSAADLDMALRIAVNAKVQRPATCNAMETLLVDRAVAAEFLPRIAAEFEHRGVEIRACQEAIRFISAALPASDEHYRTEYLGLTCNIRVVSGMDQAVAHIEDYGSNHTDAIVTESYEAARRFIRAVDSSSVMVNASTRLADGAVYGLGAEIGISTDKLHAFGPMGVQELTTKKFFVLGQGSLRS